MPSLQAQAERIADRYQPPAVGRPSLLGDPETVQKFLTAVADGNYIETACKLAGLTKTTVYDWLKIADEHPTCMGPHGHVEDSPHKRFSDALKNAEAMSEAQDVANVRAAGKAGPQYWAASMTYLERRHPERWGKRQDEQSGPKVIVQIGVKDSDVQIAVMAVAPSSDDSQVNVIANYQTQTIGESESLQVLTAPQHGATEAKAVGRK